VRSPNLGDNMGHAKISEVRPIHVKSFLSGCNDRFLAFSGTSGGCTIYDYVTKGHFCASKQAVT